MTLGAAGLLLAASRPVFRRIHSPRSREWLMPAGIAVAILAGSFVARLVPFPDVLAPSGPTPHWRVIAPREAAAAVRAAAGRYDLVKLYERLPARTFLAAARAARETGIHSVAHVPASLGLARTLRSGVDELAHVYFLVVELQAFMDTVAVRAGEQRDSALRRRLGALVADVRRSNVDVTSTLMPLPEVLELESDSSTFLARNDMQYRTPEARRAAYDRMRGIGAPLGYDVQMHVTWGMNAARELVRAGVPLVLGTDASPTSVLAGFAVHDEIRLLLACGLTPFEALRTATVNASRVAGASAAWGIVAVGKRADLILADANPLVDPGTLRQPRGVMVAGRWYDRAALDSLLATVVSHRARS